MSSHDDDPSQLDTDLYETPTIPDRGLASPALAVTETSDLASLALAVTETSDLASPALAVTETSGLAVSVVEPRAEQSLPGYQVRGVIGSGGMGEVVLGTDVAIDRDVAIKRLKPEERRPEAVARFLREARLQARLEHPSIVPVHEVGRDAAGAPYFTMKRVIGQTLAQRLESGPPSPQELLRILVDVCRALELAHSKGVVHRDLKPPNVMIGDFGEVYVLDWGVARLVDGAPLREESNEIAGLDGLTQAGAIVGTVGYMSPEQAHGATDVGTAADVYAVGVMLFEVLTLTRLHPKGHSGLATTVGGIDGSPARRRPDLVIPPELDALCLDALQLDPRRRPTIKVVGDRIQRYLDGDRDHERRCALAAAALAEANAAYHRGNGAQLVDAFRHAGRALALDPESREAAALVATMMLEPPNEPPPALIARLADSDAKVQRRQSRAAVSSQVAVLIFLGVAALTGATAPGLLACYALYTCALAGFSWWVAHRRGSPVWMWGVAIGNAILAMLLSRLFGSLIVAPVVTCIMAVSLTSYPALMRHAGWVIALLVASWLLPVVLESTGVLAASWDVHEGALISHSAVMSLEGVTTPVLLIGANVLAIIVIGLFANALARTRRAAQQDSELQAWQLEQLVPSSAARSAF